MKHVLLQTNACGSPSSHKLTLFFAGWSAHEQLFRHCVPAEADLLVVYDYRDLTDFPFDLANSYAEVKVVAWSMGVWAASQLLPRLTHTVQAVAVNGTPWPMDDTRGIPTAIYQGTMEGLSASSLAKFQRRMCADGTAFKAYQELAVQRPIEELKEELARIIEQFNPQTVSATGWTKAFVGGNDRIIPAANQLAAWQELHIPVEQTNHSHYDECLLRTLLTQ